MKTIADEPSDVGSDRSKRRFSGVDEDRVCILWPGLRSLPSGGGVPVGAGRPVAPGVGVGSLVPSLVCFCKA